MKLTLWMGDVLRKAHMKGTPKQYINKAVKISALFAIISIAVMNSFFEEPDILLGAAILVFALMFGLFICYPLAKKNKIAKLFEKDLAFVLMGMSVEMNLGLQFEKCIDNVCKARQGIVSEEFRKARNEMQCAGTGMEAALKKISNRIDSRACRRAIVQLINVYRLGNRKNAGAPLKRVARELLSEQHAEIKSFSSKMAMMSLVFIMVSAILPGFFQAGIIVGSVFMKIELSGLAILGIVGVLFPIINLIVLLVVRSSTPVVLKG